MPDMKKNVSGPVCTCVRAHPQRHTLVSMPTAASSRRRDWRAAEVTGHRGVGAEEGVSARPHLEERGWTTCAVQAGTNSVWDRELTAARVCKRSLTTNGESRSELC